MLLSGRSQSGSDHGVVVSRSAGGERTASGETLPGPRHASTALLQQQTGITPHHLSVTN